MDYHHLMCVITKKDVEICCCYPSSGVSPRVPLVAGTIIITSN